MITGLHGMVSSSDAAATRAALRDVLQLPANDIGGGWLIYDLPKADLGEHPTGFEGSPPAGTHDVSFVRDDLEARVAGIKGRGGVFDTEIADRGFGFTTHITLPGGPRVQLHQPKYG
jgi:predicted enzyme related to lactoylglutathione lyase